MLRKVNRFLDAGFSGIRIFRAFPGFIIAIPISNSIVLATGGGIVIEAENRELLASRGTVFYLHTPLETQISRTAKDKDRPLLKNGDPGEILKNLHLARESLYKEVADYSVNTEGKSSQEVSSEIIKLVKNYG